MSRISERIGRALGGQDLVQLLATRVKPTDLQSLLLEVFQRRAAKRTAPEVLRRYVEDRFTAPSPADPRLLAAFDRLAFEGAAPTFEPIELSPVAPLGAVSALTGLDQNLAVSTIRNSEVVSDSTNVMALECARRRREARSAAVRLCSSHRLLRGQAYDFPGARTHFRLFGLCTAGRASGGWQFELDSLVEQLRVYLRLLSRLPELGRAANHPHVTLTALDDGPPAAMLESHTRSCLRDEFPDLTIDIDSGRMAGSTYYSQLCFGVAAAGPQGEPFELVDGGLVNWTQLLLSDRKERLLISGIGSERACSLGATS